MTNRINWKRSFLKRSIDRCHFVDFTCFQPTFERQSLQSIVSAWFVFSSLARTLHKYRLVCSRIMNNTIFQSVERGCNVVAFMAWHGPHPKGKSIAAGRFSNQIYFSNNCKQASKEQRPKTGRIVGIRQIENSAFTLSHSLPNHGRVFPHNTHWHWRWDWRGL